MYDVHGIIFQEWKWAHAYAQAQADEYDIPFTIMKCSERYLPALAIQQVDPTGFEWPWN